MKLKLRDIKERFLKRRRGSATTIHYMFPLVAATFSIFGAAYLSGGSSYVQMTPTPAYVEAGDEVMIKVEAVAVSPVNTVDIEIMFPEQLKPTGVDTGGSVITLWTIDPKVEGKKVTLRGGVFRKGFLGKHTIATIRARAITTGEADVLVRNSIFLAGDGKGTPLKLDTKNNKVAVQIGATGVRDTKNSGGTISGKIAVQVITDIDGDTDVDFNDIEAFMSAWRNRSAVFDFSGDGKMSFRDFAILLADSFLK